MFWKTLCSVDCNENKASCARKTVYKVIENNCRAPIIQKEPFMRALAQH